MMNNTDNECDEMIMWSGTAVQVNITDACCYNHVAEELGMLCKEIKRATNEG
jgi:hypothetical protein